MRPKELQHWPVFHWKASGDGCYIINISPTAVFQEVGVCAVLLCDA